MAVSEDVLAGMRATNTLFCNEVGAKRNVAALDQVYTEGARILPPGSAQVTGREGIKAFWAAAVAAMNVKSAILESVEVNEAGDGLCEIGRATIVTADGAAELKYVVFWKQEGGAWKWDIDIWN